MTKDFDKVMVARVLWRRLRDYLGRYAGLVGEDNRSTFIMHFRTCEIFVVVLR